MSEEKNFKELFLDKLNNNQFTVYYYVPSMNGTSGGIRTLAMQARVLKDAGYNVAFLFEPRVDERASYQASTKAQKRIFIYEKLDYNWMDVNLTDIPFLPQVGADERGQQVTKIKYNDGSEENITPTQINAEDFIIIPEGFGNVMQQLAQSGCKKIVLAQSWIYILNSLQAGQTWETFGITDCISISDAVSEYIKSIMPNVKIKQYSQSINRNIFNVPEKKSSKYPLIGFSCTRGPENRLQTYNAIKNFQAWYPHYKWVRFVELAGLSKEQYAERLKECSLYIYTDQISGFGTAPLEAMACGTHVVGWSPFGSKEYINPTNGFWCNNGDIFQLAEFIGIAVDKLLTGELDNPEIQTSYEQTLTRYTEDAEKSGILQIFKEYLNERIDEISKL